ncbi:MAG: uracil-DNA glycosylase [Eubacteriales bacterium]
MEWDELEAECSACRKCALGATRTNNVFGTGSRGAKLMFIGEAPGETEDQTGQPFVGRAGKLLDKYFEAVGIDRDEVFIANILKCRPPQNRDPLPEEEDMCIEWLRRQVKLIDPPLIVCLGRIAAQRLIKPDFKITGEHGVWFERGRVSMCAVYHPSYLLRGNIAAKEAMLGDMKEIKRRLDAEYAKAQGGSY